MNLSANDGTVTSYEYIVVGAGSAGCVLAYRLSEDPSTRVLLIEAGPTDAHPFIHMPKGIGKLLADPAHTWVFPTDPEPGNNHTPEFWVRGRTLGGSSAVNGMMYVRGQPADFDGIAALTSPDWSWEHIGAAYRAIEDHPLGPAPTRGTGGPLRLSMPRTKTALSEAIIAAGVSMGLPRKSDLNEPDNREGVGYAPITVRNGWRQSAAVAFLKPVLDRKNLTVVTETLVDRVLFEGGRAVSVVCTRRGATVEFRARREIILSAGALQSPAILQRSGIGPAAHLAALGIPVVADRPGVGANLREHRILIMQCAISARGSQNRAYRGLRLAANVLRYYLTKTGPMADATYEIGAFLKSDPALDRPDIQFLFAPYSYDFSKRPALALEQADGFHVCAYVLRPESQGTVLIQSKDPAQVPRIAPHYRTAPHDTAKLVHVFRLARRYFAQPPLRDLIGGETWPGAAIQTDADILSAFDRMGGCGYHGVGTCRMGNDEDSVVDPRLRVRGVGGLRVMDTSVPPVMPSGNTNGPMMAMAWRAADLILADA